MRGLGMLLLMSACYAPRYQPGVACSEQGACPRGQECAADWTCQPIGHGGGPNGTGDGGLDGAIDTSGDATACFGQGLVTWCAASAPTDDRTITGSTTWDTDDDATCTAVIGANPELCMVAAGSIELSGQLRAEGTRPLVLVAAGSLIVSGTLDVASRHGMARGAGAALSCPSGSSASGSGGGYGGSFGGRGGNGSGPIGSNHGVAPAPSAAPTALHGGCSGSDGRSYVGSHGSAGHGGGAVYLIAGSTIQVTSAGVIDASGQGGTGCPLQCGAGGGGSGGMIGLDAPSIQLDLGSEVFANGGGGGEGSSTSASKNGDDPVNALSAASGGHGSTGGCSGGDGAQGGDLDGGAADAPGSSATDGGGGGGGAAGVIRVFGSVISNGRVSPSPS